MLTELRRTKLTTWFGTLDQDGDGALTEEDFKRRATAAADSLGLDPASADYQKVVEANMLFWNRVRDIVDLDDDRRLTLQEWLQGMDAFTRDQRAEIEAMQRDQVQRVFRAIDTDGDGRISREEYVATGSRTLNQAAVEEAFAALDTDGSGYVTPEEFQRHMAEFLFGEDPQAAGNSMMGRLG